MTDWTEIVQIVTIAAHFDAEAENEQDRTILSLKGRLR